MQRIRRALIDLRRGEPVLIDNNDQDSWLVLAIENLDESRFRTVQTLASGPLRLLLTGHRARALGLSCDSDDAVALSPVNDGGQPTLAQFIRFIQRPDPALRPTIGAAAEQAAVAMARHAGLMPALLALPARPHAGRLRQHLAAHDILAVSAEDVTAFGAAGGNPPERISEARVPLEGAEASRFVLYRERDGLLEHIAVLVGDPDDWPAVPALRMHSACLTGDLFGSLRCDCGEQLRGAVATLSAEGGGILLYLAQEGRGIGLANKLRAYGLQDRGFDTVDADQLLGFGEDERRYETAAAMLQDLGIRRVRLLTNNPAKLAALSKAGIDIAGREALHGQLNPHNARYLTAKADRTGHWLQEVLTEGLPDGPE